MTEAATLFGVCHTIEQGVDASLTGHKHVAHLHDRIAERASRSRTIRSPRPVRQISRGRCHSQVDRFKMTGVEYPTAVAHQVLQHAGLLAVDGVVDGR